MAAGTTTATRAPPPEHPGKQFKDEIEDLKLRWTGGMTQTISKYMFNSTQFITNPEQEEWGSIWQDLVCDHMPRPSGPHKEVITEEFWKQHGRSMARSHLNRRRQNTTQTMKTRFRGKLACSGTTPHGKA